MNIIDRIRELAVALFVPFLGFKGEYNYSPVSIGFTLSKEYQIEILREEIKKLQLSILIAKKQKKKTSHFYSEMAKLQAEVLRLEA